MERKWNKEERKLKLKEIISKRKLSTLNTMCDIFLTNDGMVVILHGMFYDIGLISIYVNKKYEETEIGIFDEPIDKQVLDTIEKFRYKIEGEINEKQ